MTTTLRDLAPRGVAPPDTARAADMATLLRELAEPLRGLCVEVVGASPFLATCMERHADWLRECQNLSPGEVATALTSDLAVEDDEGAMEAMREARERLALLVALADLGRAWDLDAVTEALSEAADAACRTAWRLGVAHAVRRRKLPPGTEPGRGGFVLAMGKHGAGELNYSSDIDLVCFYERERCEADDPGTGFVEAARHLTHVLSANEGGRIVHRVDWRLRPDPGATPLSVSTAAALNYYQSQARSWERLAFIKARVVAGDREAGEAFLAALEPFVWRRTLDFHVAGEMAALAARIRARGGEHALDADPGGWNVKTGLGGIREIEFLVQSQQTVLGGRHPNLRSPRTRSALRLLAAHGSLEDEAARALDAAYVHHRTLEHRLQMLHDRQTQIVPEPGEERARLAALDGQGEAALLATLARHRATVVPAFETVMGRPRSATPEVDAGEAERALALLDGPLDPSPDEMATDEVEMAFAALGFAEGARAARTVHGWLAARYPSFRSAEARRLAERRLPELLRALGSTRDPDTALAGLDRALARAPAGLPWHAMLDARPALIGLLARLAGEAPALMDALARDPALLAEAAGSAFWGSPETEEIEARAAGLERDGDIESAMDAVRLVNREEMFRIGCRILEGADPYEIGADIALVTETLLRRLWDAALRERAMPDAPLALLAMGRLGAREMTLSSDLDLVVLSESHETAATDARFVRTLVAAVGSPTGEGRFREVDMRLRPSGRAGPLVTPLPGFVRHHETAEAWEMIALGRCRPVAGSPAMMQAAGRAIREARLHPRDRAQLLEEADAVLARVRAERPAEGPDDAKNRPGGLFEIEFTVHLARVLARDPTLAEETRTPELLKGIARQGVPDTVVSTLLEGHRDLSARIQRRAVTGRIETAGADASLESMLSCTQAACAELRELLVEGRAAPATG